MTDGVRGGGYVTRRPATRRNLRSARGSQRYTPAVVVPLPTTAYEYWIGSSGASPTAAVGRLAGITLTGVNTPVVAADPGFFNNRTVFQTSFAGSRHWRSTGLTTGILAGTRPVIYTISRSRIQVASFTATMHQQGGGGVGAEESGFIYASDGAGTDTVRFDRTIAATYRGANSGDISDTNAHLFKLVFGDAVLGSALYMDGALVANVATGGMTGALAQDWTYATIGSNGITAGNYANGSFAFILWCTAPPSAPEDAALLAWSQATFGTP